MAVRVSRRKLAEHVAEQLAGGSKTALQELAAFLVDTGRTREVDMIVRDIEQSMAERGTVVVTVESAQVLTSSARKRVEDVVQARYDDTVTVSLREVVNPDLLGGVVIRTPREEMDASVRRALANLKATNIKE